MLHDCKNLTVKSVVDAVNSVFRRGLLDGESGLVLLEHFLLSGSHSGDGQNIRDLLVWSVCDNFSSNGGVHTGHTKVGTDVGVVKIDDLSTTEVDNVLVVNHGVGSGGDGGSTESGGSSKEGLTVH